MNKIAIEYWFSAGFRCNATDFSVKYGFRKYSSPFDYMYLDFESMLQIISKRFEDFLNDIVVLDGHYHTLINYNSKNSQWVKPEYYPLLNIPIRYMRESFLKTFVRFNQNYTGPGPEPGSAFVENLYDWPRICIHHHHNVTDEKVIDYMAKRCRRFLRASDTNYKTCILFHITKIMSRYNIRQEISRILSLKNKYNNRSYMVYIMCCDDRDEDHFFIDRCLFIVKKVPSYDQQYFDHGTENHVKYLNYDRENELIREHFDIQLTEKEAMD
jgi:hypothetical protein